MVQSGPIYDNAMKAMCAHVPLALCRWLGVEVDGEVSSVRLSETVPALAARQVDALIAIGRRLVLHVEFQSNSEAAYGLRMLDYRLRLYRRPEIAGKELVQHVVMLGTGRVEDGLSDGELAFRYQVHYLRDQRVEPLLADPALAPLAALAAVPDPERPEVLRRALDLIATVADDHLRTVLAYATVDLAGLRLGSDIINSTWEDTEMPIPSLLNRTYHEGQEAVVAAMLRHRFADDGRIPTVAHRLAALDPDEAVTRIDKAQSLDDLAGD